LSTDSVKQKLSLIQSLYGLSLLLLLGWIRQSGSLSCDACEVGFGGLKLAFALLVALEARRCDELERSVVHRTVLAPTFQAACVLGYILDVLVDVVVGDLGLLLTLVQFFIALLEVSSQSLASGSHSGLDKAILDGFVRAQKPIEVINCSVVVFQFQVERL